MKISAIKIYSDWCRIRAKTPSYRLGQHYCNVLGLKDTVHSGVDLFTCPNDKLSDTVFYEMCEKFQWDVFDLPIFGDYDLSTIKPA